jgi:hypothetical protein
MKRKYLPGTSTEAAVKRSASSSSLAAWQAPNQRGYVTRRP